jgi:hypothetical protein
VDLSSSNRVGVLFVEGVGTAHHSDTLIDFGAAFFGWVARWQKAQGQVPEYGTAELNFGPYDGGSDHPIPSAVLRFPRGPARPNAEAWVCAEAWWNYSTRPMPFTALIGWSFRYLFALLTRLFQYVSSPVGGPFWRIKAYSVHDGGWWYRLMDLLTAVGHVIGYAALLPVGYTLLIPLAVLAQVPVDAVANFAAVTLARVFLQYNASQLLVYYADEIQGANMRRRVAEGIRWLTRSTAEGGGGCDSVVIVAHSGGVWVAHGMLSDQTYAREARHVRKFITMGSGLSKIWQIAPTEVTRLYSPIAGNLYWLDFWSSYDPVPVGWLEPPRVGPPDWRSFLWYRLDTRPFHCIYKPGKAIIADQKLSQRVDPMPPFTEAHGSTLISSAAPKDPDEAPNGRGSNWKDPDAVFWPDSIRVVNRMDALTDHGGYFTNDEEVLRRIAAEIDSDVHSKSIFWPGDEIVNETIRARRDRVGVLATARIGALIVGVTVGGLFASDIAAYLAGIGPITGLLGIAREVYLAVLHVPLIGARLGFAWGWLVALLLWLAGAAVASLVGLVPYEIFRSVWEHHDLDVRNTILRRNPPAWVREEFSFEHRRHSLYRTGSGPAVIVMHEFPGLSPSVLSLARVIADAGFTVYVPWLFGDVNHTIDLAYSVRSGAAACISKEFAMFSRGSTAPVATWLRALAREVRSPKSKGVGVIGLCFTGGFALATIQEPSVLASVVSEPALPVGLLPWTRKKKGEDIGLSPQDIQDIANRMKHLTDLPNVLGFRFSCDNLSPEARFKTLRSTLGDNFEGEVIPSGPGSIPPIPARAHSVLTVDRVPDPDHPTEKALGKVIAFLQRKLQDDDQQYLLGSR